MAVTLRSMGNEVSQPHDLPKALEDKIAQLLHLARDITSALSTDGLHVIIRVWDGTGVHQEWRIDQNAQVEAATATETVH